MNRNQVFDKREERMRLDANILSRNRRPQFHEMPLVCAAHNCSNVRRPGSRHCDKCDKILARPVGNQNPFATAFYLCVVCGGLTAFGCYAAPYAFATVKLWIGGLLCR